jgi:hypothetical protein
MHLFGLPSTQLRVDLKLDREEPVYSHQDTISGEVTLHTDFPTEISSISLNLSAVATARLRDGRRAEVHQVCSYRRSFRLSNSGQESFLTFNL